VNVNLFIFTDEWVFRVRFVVAGDISKRKIENLYKNLQFVGRSKDTGTAASGEDASVRGLWLEIPGLPEAESTVFNAQPGGEGEAYFERTMNDDALLAVSIERTSAKDSASGTTLTPGDTAKLAARLVALRKEITLDEYNITVTESVEKLAEIYTYPTSTRPT
jgi:hypothetical protein